MTVLRIVFLFCLIVQSYSSKSYKSDDIAPALGDESFRQPFATIFNEALAKRLWKIASSPYLLENHNDDKIRDCLFNRLKFSQIKGDTEFISNFCNNFTDKFCVYVFGVDHESRTIHITGSGLNDSFPEYILNRHRPSRQFHELNLHETAYTEFDYFWNQIGGRKGWQRRRLLYPGYKLILSGHETSGHVAMLAAFDLVKSKALRPSEVSVVIFGAPMPFVFGNSSAAYSRVVPDTFHVTRQGDSVPRLPKGYRGYEGLPKEVYYSDSSTHRVCQGNADPNCSQGTNNANSTVEANHVYYGTHLLEACFSSN